MPATEQAEQAAYDDSAASDELCADEHALANRALDVGRPEEAVEALQRCAQLQPQDASSQWNVGVLLNRLGRPDEALYWMGKAMELAPDSVRYRRGAASAALSANEPELAIVHLESALHQLLKLGNDSSWEGVLGDVRCRGRGS